MRLNRFFFWVFFLLFWGLISCRQENPEIISPEEEGNTYISVMLQIPSSRSRANKDEDYNYKDPWTGRDKIETVDLYIADAGNPGKELIYRRVDGDGITPNNTVYILKPVKTTAGQKKVYAVVNANDEIRSALTTAASKGLNAFESAYADPYAVIATAPVSGANGEKEAFKEIYSKEESDKDVIVMSGVFGTLNVIDGVTAEESKNGLNRVKLELRRISARVVASVDDAILKDKATDPWVEISDGSFKGRLYNLSWSVAQYEKNTFLLQQENNLGVVSPSYDFVPTDLANYEAKAPGKYDYSLLKERFFVLKSVNKNLSVSDIVSLNMKFIAETTHKIGVLGDDNYVSNYRCGNTPYILVRGTFFPDKSMIASSDILLYDSNTKGVDLYYGLIDHKFYFREGFAKYNNKTKETRGSGTLVDPGSDPIGPPIGGNDKDLDNVIKYEGGQMFYFVWVNPDATSSDKWYNSPVIRNNIYHIHILGFHRGHSGNPFNPDPNNPNKPDPDEKTPKPEDPIVDQTNDEDVGVGWEWGGDLS